MCTRFVLLEQHYRDILQRLGIGAATEYLSRYNIAPGTFIPAIRSRPGASGRELASLRWGLVPAWSKDDQGLRPANARSESIASKPSFRQAFKSRRCVIPASGFYEWEHRTAFKQPWLIRRRDEQPLIMAGLWESWHAPDGKVLETCALITTRPNELMQRIHDRMPVLLAAEQCETWLDPRVTDPVQLTPLLEPSPAADLQLTAVSRYVSNSRNEGPACLAPAEAAPPGPDSSQLSLGI